MIDIRQLHKSMYRLNAGAGIVEINPAPDVGDTLVNLPDCILCSVNGLPMGAPFPD